MALTLSGSALGLGKVLQVVEGSTTTYTNNDTNVYADTTLSATITPTSTTSKVLVLVSQCGMLKTSNASSAIRLILLRGSTQIATLALTAGYNATTTRADVAPVCGMILDSPATTSATTYKTQFSNQVNAAGVYCQNSNERSSMILVEIAP